MSATLASTGRRCALAIGLALASASSGCALAPAAEEAVDTVTSPIYGGKLDSATHGVVMVNFIDAHDGKITAVGTCSGTLIAKNLVLTARHCVAPLSTEDLDSDTEFLETSPASGFLVSTATQASDTSDSWHTVREVRTSAAHAKLFGSDIAFLILNDNVAEAEAEPLPPQLDIAPKKGDSFSAIGYGIQQDGDAEGVTVGSRMRADGESVFCIGLDCPGLANAAANEWVARSAACPGDSGGPAISSTGHVIGVTSRGGEKCSEGINVYSNVASWSSLVRSTAMDAAVLGNYAPPAWVSPGDPSSANNSTTHAHSGGSSSCSMSTPSIASHFANCLAALLGLAWLTRKRLTRARRTAQARP